MSPLWCACVVWLSAGWPAPAHAVVGGAPAAAPEPDAAVVFLRRRGVSARLEGIKDDKLGYYSFFGIRFAEPAVGVRRFQRPVPRRPAGDVTATAPCRACPQPDPARPGRVIGDEDCLCLNVFAPKMPGEEQGSPVIFFIHGGNYRSGSAASYGGQHLNQKDTILVTAQYRLGSLGFLSTGQKDAAGNAGLFDLRAAFNWVQTYIEFFGGDPSRIIVMGQGSGGSAASLLALSPEGRSARGVAALSGTPLSPGAVRADPGHHASALAAKTSCPSAPAERLLACLRQMSIENIINADVGIIGDMVETAQFLDEISGRSGAGARVEGKDDLRGLPPLIAEDPAETLEKMQQGCPLLTGVTSAETSRAVYGKYSKFLINQLTAIRDFIKTDLVGGLRSLTTGVGGLVQAAPGAAAPLGGLIPTAPGAAAPLADYYQALFDNSLKAVDGLSQIAEATGDALFNFPAYQTVKAWSSGAAAYLYSFEHAGNMTRGAHFLAGIPLADNPTMNEMDPKERTNAPKGPAHGDELAYIFEPLDPQGRPLPGAAPSATDARVREAFVSLLARFAHELSPREKKNTTGLASLLPFSKDNEQYLKIGEDITVDKNFRFCQMGLWGNMADRITGALCKNFLGNLLMKATKLPLLDLPGKVAEMAPVKPEAPLPIVPNLSLFGSKATQKSKKGGRSPFPFGLQ